MSLGIYNEKCFELDKKNQNIRQVRSERYAYQAVAKKALPTERVAKCLRYPIKKSEIDVWKHLDTQRSFFGNLMVCGSVWNCPVCASKISEKRRMELKSAFDIHSDSGGSITMMTLTFRHTKNDNLKDILDKFNKSIRRFRSGSSYSNVMKNMGLIGSIRAYEVTYGKNGFHPHVHILLFHDNKIEDYLSIQAELYRLWMKACKANNLSTMSQFGLKLNNANEADNYISKHGVWSIDKEMTKFHVKKGRDDNLTPFDFLRNYVSSEDPRWLKLFQTYAAAFKGKRQLYWSPGLKDKFLIDDKTDDVLAKEKLEEADLLGSIEYELWRHILKHDLRSKFLDLTEQYSFFYAYNFVIDYVTKKNTDIGRVDTSGSLSSSD